ncbi:putative Ig domain-containing protein, partial [bacterium]|nr:putative Ig domain-containing protein [bacterium]
MISPVELTERPILFVSSTLSPAALLSNVMAVVPDLNIPPVWDWIDNQTVSPNHTLLCQFHAIDLDHESLSYSMNPLPPGATLDPQTGAFTWTPSASQVGTHLITCVATDIRGVSSSNATFVTVLTNTTAGLTAHWKLDENSGTTTVDSINNNTGALVGFDFDATSGWASGRWDRALLFDGVDDYVALDSASNELNLTNNFAVSFWVYPNQPAGEAVCLALRSLYGTSGLRIWVVQNSLRLEGRTTAGWRGIRFALRSMLTPAWYHIAIVYDKSLLKVYVNGIAQSAATGANPNWGGDFVMDPQGLTEFGADSFHEYFFDGRVDDVRLYTRSLTEPEAAELHRGTSNQPPVLDSIGPKTANEGEALSFVVSASDPDTPSLSYAATGLPGGASFDAATQTFSWTPASGQEGTYNVTFIVSDGNLSDGETVTIAMGDIPDGGGPVAHWALDDETGLVATDAVGDADGTLAGFVFGPGSGWVAGRVGGALQLDGTNDAVVLDSTAGALALTNNFSVAAWVKAQNAAGEGLVLADRFKYRSNGLRIWVANNAIRVEAQTTAGWRANKFGLNTIQDGVWQHLAVVYDQGQLRVYVDGIERAIAYGSAAWGGDILMAAVGSSSIGAESTYAYYLN